MKMKKYYASSIPEAMKQVRAELGEDAVILNSKVVITKKFFGLIKKKSFEVVAGVDAMEPRQVASVPSPAVLPVAKKENARLQEITNAIQAKIHQEPPQDVAVHEDASISEELRKEIADLKSLMQSMHKKTTQAQYPDELLPFIEYLRQQELSEELITTIGDELFMHFKEASEINFSQCKLITKNLLRKKLEVLPVGGLSYERKYINILGPTGVGKTTTIAKMAARAVLEKKKKIGFITTDTYRIAAIEQLKTYAGLLQAPVEIAYNATDFEQAIQRLSHLDLVFIDTAGRNYKEVKYVDDLQRLIKFDDQAESYLVLAMTTKERDMENIVDQFKQLPIEKFIFTKIDETNSIGTMINLMIKYNKGLAYYTNGQEVPEDIEEADLEAVLNLFFQGEEK
ncbi:flagellar biosynthesis protein FlhF [Lysinibacillus boronitolerans]|uniref:Flagellar biosynthesis protein FlhF n=1 Tax=Lysinibacillus boronitolerans JCM 21713 = 10a = NBRC 103108 TaxID=1294264 RepID=A0ABR4XVE8_9BACI|nr:flagellar biosynthesis protein FlhF [Lysinibacillus boronitolerans]KGR81410.1 flagellar biosynthesis regulator FlhF [Lysinibacillus boronitolerans JCM 21713 = 10a = NBRC 103108]